MWCDGMATSLPQNLPTLEGSDSGMVCSMMVTRYTADAVPGPI